MIHDGITRKQVAKLAASASDPAISIYIPTARAGADVLQGRIRLKNLLTQAEDLLVDRGMRRTIALDLLSEIAKLDADVDFWNDRLDSVAFFAAPGFLQVYHLPFQTSEFLQVGKRFHVRPVLPMLYHRSSWYVLALDKNHVRLVHCRARLVSEVIVPSMPQSLEEFISLEHKEKQLQYHSGGRAGAAGASIGHGAGDKGIDDKDRLHRFCVAVARSAEAHLAATNDPVVLAGTSDVQDSFREVAKLAHLAPTGIIGSPKMLDLRLLQSESAPIVKQYGDSDRLAAIEHYKEIAGTGLTSQQIEVILPAAEQGRVDVFLAYENSVAWGSYNAESGRAVIHSDPMKNDSELLNEAAIATVENNGTVYAVSSEEVAITGPAAAIFRY